MPNTVDAEPLEVVFAECLSREGGFLPPRVPLVDLPSPFTHYCAAADELSARYHGPDASVRRWLRAEFAGWTDHLRERLDALGLAQAERLMAVVSLLAHAFRWDSAPPRPENYALRRIDLPAGLCEPWTALARRLDQPRVGNLYSMVLSNWRLAGKRGGDAYANHELSNDSIEIVHSWLKPPERDALQAFVRTGILTEARGVAAIRTAMALIAAARRGESPLLRELLPRFAAEIDEVGAAFKHNIRDRHIRHGSFLTLIQPTTIWGIDHGQGSLEGASGPQIGSIQVIDAVLGLGHSTDMGRAILQSRTYMPGRHRRFLDRFERDAVDLRAFVAVARCSDLTHHFNQCVAAMLAWRRMHVKRAAHYLKGDGVTEVSHYASTGHVVELEDERVQAFAHAMAERMAETTQALVAADERCDGAMPPGAVSPKGETLHDAVNNCAGGSACRR